MILRFAAEKKSLYVSRPLKNADEFIKWAKAQGFETTESASEMHVTIAHSKKKVDWFEIPEPSSEELVVNAGGARAVVSLGNDGAVVLRFVSEALNHRHEDIKKTGVPWKWPDYEPHVTITYEPGEVDIDEVEPYDGKLVFGPEQFEEIENEE